MEKCFRCAGKLQDNTPPDVAGIKFFACMDCGAGYAKKPGQDLHDRWLMPLSVVLYAVIFEREPYLKAKSVAKYLLDQKNTDLLKLKEHILEEIKTPKQKVSQIHDFAYPDEVELRKYLVAVYEHLNASKNV